MGEHRKQWISQVLSNVKKKDKVAEKTGERKHIFLVLMGPCIVIIF
jgi:hypothetical protein